MSRVRAVDWRKFEQYRYKQFKARDIASHIASKYGGQDMPTWAFVVYMFGLANPMFVFQLPTSPILPNPRVHVIVDNSKAHDKGPNWEIDKGIFSREQIQAIVTQITSEGIVNKPLLDLQADMLGDAKLRDSATNGKMWAELQV